MLSKSMRCTENYNTCSQHCSIERAQFFPITVPYHTLQTSTSKQGNVVTITNNSFKNVGHIVLYFSYKNSASVNISNNVFYKEVSTVNPNVGLRAESGLYVFQAGSSSITLGANTWEEIPEISDLNFHNVNVNLSEQRTIGE